MAKTEKASTRLQYGQRPSEPGMYLGLFHGRNSPKESMDDWGFAGPVLGPLRYCHTTYMAHLRLHFVSGEDAMSCCHASSLAVELAVVQDLIEFEGAFYGDWTLFFVAPEECKRPDDGFRHKPRSNLYQWHCNT